MTRQSGARTKTPASSGASGWAGGRGWGRAGVYGPDPIGAGLIACGAGFGCASGASCGRPCGDLFLGDGWPCVLLNGRRGSTVDHTPIVGSGKPRIIPDPPARLKPSSAPNRPDGPAPRAGGP